MKSEQLTIPESQPLATRQQPDIASMLQAVIEKGVTAENTQALATLCNLFERVEAKNAERAFAAAFVDLQAEIPKIEPTRGIPDKSGRVKFMYAPYEEIMRKVRPLLTKHGFTITFDNDFADGRVVVTCKLQHIGGHKTETRHAARVGHGPVNSSEAQADGAAQTYAKRFALCSALNIVIEHDTDASDADARNIGGPISEEDAATLRALVEETGSDKAKFLAFAGAPTFEEIPASRYADLVDMLNRKRK